jgi:hypothetical protein
VAGIIFPLEKSTRKKIKPIIATMTTAQPVMIKAYFINNQNPTVPIFKETSLKKIGAT